METVSEKYYISLGKPLQCEYICLCVQNLINKAQQHNQDLSASILILSIQSTIESNDNHIMKLELKDK